MSGPPSGQGPAGPVRGPEARTPRVAVCVNRVPPGDPETGRRGPADRPGPGRLNPGDGPALDLALRTGELTGARVDVFSMGPAAALDALGEALSLGCDEGWLLHDQDLAGADALATARALAAALDRKGPYDLVVWGESCADGGTGQVGPALAALRSLVLVTGVTELISAASDHVVVRKLAPGESIALRVFYPALLVTLGEAVVPRLPKAGGVAPAKKASVLTARELGDPALFGERGSKTAVPRTRRLTADPARSRAATGEEAASILIKEVDALARKD